MEFVKIPILNEKFQKSYYFCKPENIIEFEEDHEGCVYFLTDPLWRTTKCEINEFLEITGLQVKK